MNSLRKFGQHAKTWPFEEARKVLNRANNSTTGKGHVLFETGYGPSGLPHIGTFGEVVRTTMVRKAFQVLSDTPTRLFAFSDDMDGLRKIPEGFPDSLEEHLGKPVSLIPDPTGEHESYGMHMSSRLLDGLEKLGIKYTFKRARDTYKDGILQNQIHTILTQSEKIGAKIEELVGQEKYQKFLPYFPVCSECSRLYTAEATEYLSDEKKVVYNCHDADICLLYTSPSPRDATLSRMPSSA